MSKGMRFVVVSEFHHSRMVVNAVVVSLSSREVSSKVKLRQESVSFPMTSRHFETYDGEYAAGFSS